MNRVITVTRLHFNKPGTALATPLGIIVIVWIVSLIIALALQRAGLDPSNPEYAAGARNNAGIMWSLPGFLIYYGVQAVATTFPFALALGTTRRAYVAGTALASLIHAAFITAVLAVLLLLELATGHWFFDLYVFDVAVLGSGNLWTLIATAFIGVFLCLTIGSIFGAIWVRLGAKGPLVLGLALGLLLAVGVLIAVPYFADIVAWMTGLKLALMTLGIAALALIGTWACMRRTSVR